MEATGRLVRQRPPRARARAARKRGRVGRLGKPGGVLVSPQLRSRIVRLVLELCAAFEDERAGGDRAVAGRAPARPATASATETEREFAKRELAAMNRARKVRA